MAKRTKWLKRSSWRSQEQGAAASVSPAFILGSQKLFWERIRGCRGCGCPGRILCCEIKRRAIKFNVWTNRKWRLHLNFPEAFGKDVRAVSRYLIFFSLFKLILHSINVKMSKLKDGGGGGVLGIGLEMALLVICNVIQQMERDGRGKFSLFVVLFHFTSVLQVKC